MFRPTVLLFVSLTIALVSVSAQNGLLTCPLSGVANFVTLQTNCNCCQVLLTKNNAGAVTQRTYACQVGAANCQGNLADNTFRCFHSLCSLFIAKAGIVKASSWIGLITGLALSTYLI